MRFDAVECVNASNGNDVKNEHNDERAGKTRLWLVVIVVVGDWLHAARGRAGMQLLS